MPFAIYEQHVSPTIRKSIGTDPALTEALCDAIARHRQGDPGELNAHKYNADTMAMWDKEGRENVNSAVWSQFKLPNGVVILAKTKGEVTLVATRQEYEEDYSFVLPKG